MECEICCDGIDVCETALKLCDDCFKEMCICKHPRSEHVDSKKGCIHEYNLNHKTKRGEFCLCEQFEDKEQ